MAVTALLDIALVDSGCGYSVITVYIYIYIYMRDAGTAHGVVAAITLFWFWP
jgi:hypothetical protein